MSQLLLKAPGLLGKVMRFSSYALGYFKYFSNASLLLRVGLPTLFLLISTTLAYSGTANLSWNANTEPDLSSYKVYMGTASGNYGTPVSVGNTTSHTLTGLSDGTYFFAITAIDTSGNESGFSNEVSKAISTSDTTAPIISSINAGSMTSASASISWTTDEAADTQIEFGTTTSYGSLSTLNTAFVTSHNQGLSNLNSATTYHYRVLSRDAAGNLGTSGDNTFTTTSAADTTPPSLSAIASNNITTTSGAIGWTTDEASDTQVEYGTTNAYGTLTSLNASMVSSHAQILSGLNPATTYHYRVLSRDAAGNLAVSGDNTFTTLNTGDTSPPVLSGITASNISELGATITWTTDEGASARVEYGTSTSYGASTSTDNNLVTSHSRTLSGLSDATTYHYRVISQDAAGNTASSGDNTFTTTNLADTVGPVISGTNVVNIAASTATVSWNTNEAATSQVAYGSTSAYGSLSSVNTVHVTSHSRALSGLSASTTYHYAVISSDAAGNTTTGADRTFTTASATDTTAPLISGITIDNIVQTQATVHWTTDEAATAQVEYGTTTAYGQSTVQNATLLFSHSQILSGLLPGTQYHYRVLSIDTDGNLSSSGDGSFETTVEGDTTPPMDIVNFTATAENAQVQLTWANPLDSDFVGVRIRYRTDRLPSDINDGALLGDISGAPAQEMSLTHSGLNNGVTYFYLATAYDGSGNFQTTVFATATPKGASATITTTDEGPISGGCGMIRPDAGNPPGPGDSAAMLSLIGIVLLSLLRKASRSLNLQVASKTRAMRI